VYAFDDTYAILSEYICEWSTNANTECDVMGIADVGPILSTPGHFATNHQSVKRTAFARAPRHDSRVSQSANTVGFALLQPPPPLRDAQQRELTRTI